ncbi:RICIN domain-containing protein [Algibacillus agarilyticus]|uniref:RICIN domain-containing protein n=1 Tax=Algibacillus agarilyticus TaxID=2234133 RepID=UPI0018E58AB2|nr:RICIN domain-containing protein [Algibacillus agarilyticus]
MQKYNLNRITTMILGIGISYLSPVSAVTNGTYVLKNNFSGKVMDVSGRSTADGANIIQYQQNNNDNQLWDITNTGNNLYSIVSVHSNKALEVYNWDATDGANIVQWNYWGGATQLWQLDNLNNGYYGLINSFSGKGIEVFNFDTRNGANIGQWHYWAGTPQQWALEPATYVNPTANNVQFSDISVHDPSIYQTSVNGQTTYYIFGSFAAAAKSTDLMNWTSVADGVNNNNPLFGYNISNELAEGFAWTGEQSLWAADVVQLNNGQYAYYYNQSLMAAPRGYTGIATSHSIEGPYYNQGLLLKSGMWGEESENAGEIYDPTIHPNAVDPHTFYDKEGKLWLVYGSYSGGIFILEVDPGTGKPYAGQGYGQHLQGGDHSHIEGAFVMHQPDSPYYYMFVSYGGLAADGGYNVRVSRATSPKGPYYDAQGNNMANVRGDRNAIAPYGVKLMGGFELAGQYGYLSPGHQSAVHNAATGQSFLVFHTRFPNSGEYHSVRVHEMFLNDDGWPVVAPQRYVELNGENKVDSNDMLGLYQLVNHGKDINTSAKQSSTIELNSDGTVSGTHSGTWWLQSNNKFQITLNGMGTFDGVASWQWNSSINQLVTTFTALDQSGVALWATK